MITGDIIHSTASSAWLKPLKELFEQVGPGPQVWQIYRGDSFQLEVGDPHQALKTALLIKAGVKCHKPLDVRMAIGIGSRNGPAEKVTEAQGEAFVHSGQAFEKLKRHRLALRSPWAEIDRQVNICLELALLTMDHWTPHSAEVVKLALQNPGSTQAQWAEKLGITQGNVSARLKRAGYGPITKMEKHYRQLLDAKLKEL